MNMAYAMPPGWSSACKTMCYMTCIIHVLCLRNVFSMYARNIVRHLCTVTVVYHNMSHSEFRNLSKLQTRANYVGNNSSGSDELIRTSEIIICSSGSGREHASPPPQIPGRCFSEVFIITMP
jgi:hypothetical protein